MSQLGDALAEAEAQVREEADERIARLRAYADGLRGGRASDESPWAIDPDASRRTVLQNAHRADEGRPANPYRAGTSEFALFELLLDGEWHTVADGLAAIRDSSGGSFRRQIHYENVLKPYVLDRYGWALERRAGTPVAYRLVRTEAEAKPGA